MTDRPFLAEPRPRDFTARMTRRGNARPIGGGRKRRHAGRRLAVLAAAIAVPAMAAEDWRAPEGVAPTVASAPMGFETPGESFPGSAFYYLDDLPNLRNPAGVRPATEAELALPAPSAGQIAGIDESGAVAHALRFTGSATDRARAQHCLTMAIYYEAAAEPDAGQRAVAQVVLNRVAHPAYPDTVCGVVFQGSERRTGCQFSFTCDGSLARKPARMWWDRAAKVARAALSGAVYAPAGLATHYHTLQIHPYWANSLDSLGTIGAHRFYRWRGAAGRAAAFADIYRGGEPIAAPHPRQAQPAAAEADPLVLARAYEASLATTQPDLAAATVYRDKSSDTKEASVSSPQSGDVRAEYARSGQWLRQP